MYQHAKRSITLDTTILYGQEVGRRGIERSSCSCSLLRNQSILIIVDGERLKTVAGLQHTSQATRPGRLMQVSKFRDQRGRVPIRLRFIFEDAVKVYDTIYLTRLRLLYVGH